MNNNEYLCKIHDEILNVMDEVVRVCEENKIKYYLIGGTLLGAVRHKGFIPWDDDLDIVMPREDFNNFIKIAPSKLKYPFRLNWITTNKKYGLFFAKVENQKTEFKNTDGISYGIFVDIFPLDSCNGHSDNLEKKAFFLGKLKSTLFFKSTGITDTKSKCKRILTHLISRQSAYWIMHKLAIDNSEKGDYYTNFGSQYGVKKQTMPKSFYGNGVKLEFEKRMYNCPDEYEKVLTSIFGSNYMTLPPINKRVTHNPEYIKFSNGEELIFSNIGR